MSDEREPAPMAESREQQEYDDDSFLQWVALVVLLACWLAEAYV